MKRADRPEPLRSPIPTRMVSNGEYIPIPQADSQKQVESCFPSSPARQAPSITQFIKDVYLDSQITIQKQIDELGPDSWKGYNISNAAKVDTDPNSLMQQWRHDDEDVAYPTFELIEKNYGRLRAAKPGFNNICVHKGLAPGPPDPKRGHPGDLPKAASDWPNLNFITYHACIQPSFFYAVEAMWRFQIPEELRERLDYPELTETAKRKILGLNSAKLYGIQSTETSDYRAVPTDCESRMSNELKTVLEYGQYTGDNMSKLRETYAALNIGPDHTRYGWIQVSPTSAHRG